MPRWSRMFSKIPWTEPTTPRLPLIYFGVRGLPVGFSTGDDDGVADFEFAAGGFHHSSQSGRTLGASAVNPSLSTSRN